MALLNILQYPDPRLHKVAEPVAVVGDHIRKLVADMAKTMYEAPGVGPAAMQVDVYECAITIDVSESRNELRVFISPEIPWVGDEHKAWDEGCLSVPDIYNKVDRLTRVCVWALSEKGETFELEAGDLLAMCIQHEMDHLMGKVFVEYLSLLKQTRIRFKLKKYQYDTASQH